MDPTWRASFEKDGYLIVRGAISPDRANYYRDQQLRWLENSGLGFNRKQPKTFTSAHLPKSFKEGIYGQVAHERFMWEARLEQGIIDIFANIWGTRDLLVSFDGMNVTLPGVHIPAWPHTDQHGTDLEFMCAQGQLNTGPCGRNDGGLVVVRGSAALWKEYWTGKIADETKARDLNKFSNDELDWFRKRGCEVVKLELEAGDFVVWDSRTIHFNSAPKKSIRSALYLCYAPAEGAELEKKAGLFYGTQGTNHWPNVNVHATGNAKPREPCEITHELLQLAGVEPYE